MPVILNTANLRVKTALIPIFASIIVVSFFLVLCGSGDADATIHSGIEKDYLIYDLDDGDNTATVRGLNATGESQDVVIPASVEYGGITYAVTSIGDHAFFDCSSLTSVTIPESVISIGDGVFRNCYSLTGIYVDPGNANYTSTDGTLYNKIGMELIKCPARTPGDFTIPDGVIIIGSRAFEDCSSLTSVTIPYGVSSIDFCAFDGCSSLTSVTIPESVVSIGWDVFSDCSSLVSVTVPAGVTSIQSNTFQGCTSLTSVTMPENITSIGNQAFSGCSSLESITLPANLVSLGQGVFESCSSLVSVTIPASVTSIGENAFIRCTSMTAIDVDGSNTAFRSHDGVLYSKSGKDLISCPAGKSEVDLLDTATTIKSAAFLYSSIEFITITESVTHIEGGAFSSSSLTSVTIPANVTSVGGFAFSYCHALKTVHILGNTTLIENSAFRECSSLVSVTVSDSVTSIGEDAFFLCDNLVLLGILGTSETDYSEIIAKFPHTISSVVFRSAEHVEIDTIASVYWINRIGVLGSSSDPVMGGQTFSDPEGTAITDAADLRGKMFVKADGWHQISTCSDPNVIYRVNGTVAEAIGLIDRSAAYSLIGEFYNSGGIDYEVASISDNAFRESSLTGIGFLSLVAPISVGDGWITDTPSGITGHARNGSDFPVSGDSFHGLPMGENLALIPAGVKNLVYDGSEKTGVIPGTGCTVSGNTGVGAGTYEATAILTAGYIWSDGTMVDKSISWKIAKAPLSIIADDKNTTYSSEPPHYTVSYSGFVNGETDEVVNEGTATASYSRWDPVGFYPITAAGYTADNYEIIYFAGWLNVTEHSIDIPAVMTDMIYSGSEQTGVVPGTGYTVSGNTGVGAGTYEATATLTAGYIWSDGTMGNMTIFWNIAKAAYDMTGIAWSAASFVYDGSEKAVTISGLPAGVTAPHTRATPERMPAPITPMRPSPTIPRTTTSPRWRTTNGS
ncbi:MAG: leucine-rich repeat protein [Candidatus Methanomethylophilaceae archaeon]